MTTMHFTCRKLAHPVGMHVPYINMEHVCVLNCHLHYTTAVWNIECDIKDYQRSPSNILWRSMKKGLCKVQSCQLSHILCDTHAFVHNLTLTCIITLISRAKHLHTPWQGMESGWGNQRHVQLQTEIHNGHFEKTEDRRQVKPEKVE